MGDTKTKPRPNVSVLDAESVSGAKTWELPAFDFSESSSRANAAQAKPSAGKPHTAEELDQLQKQAYEEGFAEGLADGRKQAQKDNEAVLSQLRGMLDNLTTPLAELDAEVVRQVAGLSTMIAEHLVRREINWDPDAILDLAREAVSAVPPPARNVVLRLHPEDADSLQRVLPPEEGRHWQVMADAGLEKGDLQVQADSVRVDARVATRVAALAKEFKAQ